MEGAGRRGGKYGNWKKGGNKDKEQRKEEVIKKECRSENKKTKFSDLDGAEEYNLRR